jgi:hypothetical protein
MAMLTQVQILISTRDEDGEVFRNNRPPLQISHTSVKQEVVTATGSAFTALSPPSGAKAVLIRPPAGAVSLTVKGVTGDTGVTVAPASNPLQGDLFLTLGASPSLGIANGNATDRALTVVWFV